MAVGIHSASTRTTTGTSRTPWGGVDRPLGGTIGPRRGKPGRRLHRLPGRHPCRGGRGVRMHRGRTQGGRAPRRGHSHGRRGRVRGGRATEAVRHAGRVARRAGEVGGDDRRCGASRSRCQGRRLSARQERRAKLVKTHPWSPLRNVTARAKPQVRTSVRIAALVPRAERRGGHRPRCGGGWLEPRRRASRRLGNGQELTIFGSCAHRTSSYLRPGTPGGPFGGCGATPRGGCK